MITKVSRTITFASHFTCQYTCTDDLKFKMARYFLFSILILNVISALQKSKFNLLGNSQTVCRVKRWEMQYVFPRNCLMALCEHII